MTTKEQRNNWRWQYNPNRPWDYNLHPREAVNALLDDLDERDEPCECRYQYPSDKSDWWVYCPICGHHTPTEEAE